MRIEQFSIIILMASFVLVLGGCAGHQPSKEKEIRQQEAASQKAHQELQNSFQSEQKRNATEKPFESKDSPSIDRETKGLPSWVISPPASDEYVYGVGSAEISKDHDSAMDRARDRARSEILKRMEVTVSGETRTSVRREVEKGKSRVTRSVMNRVRTHVSATSLTHVQQVESHVDRAEDTVYVLLRLDRDAAQADLLSRLEEIDRRLRDIAERKTEGSRLQRLEILMPALPLFEKRRQVLEKLDRLGKKGPDCRLPPELSELRDRIGSLLDSLVVVLRPLDSTSAGLDSGLRRALSRQGLRVRQSGRGDVFLRYQAELRRIERDGVHFVFAQGSVTVLNGKGDILNEFQEKAKAASQDTVLARDRAVSELASGLGQKLADSLIISFEQELAGSL
jgi:hypothetical protein